MISFVSLSLTIFLTFFIISYPYLPSSFPPYSFLISFNMNINEKYKQCYILRFFKVLLAHIRSTRPTSKGCLTAAEIVK